MEEFKGKRIRTKLENSLYNENIYLNILPLNIFNFTKDIV